MTHSEPISVIVWQGNNITEPINISWGAALLMEQQDVAPAQQGAGPGCLPGKAQPLQSWWPHSPVSRVKDGRRPGQKDASLGQLGTSHLQPQRRDEAG